MHGLGADGHDFAGIEREVTPPGAAVRYVYPHAPMMPVTINNGYVMRAWYDVIPGDLEGHSRKTDEHGIRASQVAVERLIARERERGIASDRIVLAGFSQGGVIALQTGLRHSEKLAGIMALSTYLPMGEKLVSEASSTNKDIPIFFAHGAYDAVIAPALAAASRDKLLELGYRVEWHEYRMQH